MQINKQRDTRKGYSHKSGKNHSEKSSAKRSGEGKSKSAKPAASFLGAPVDEDLIGMSSPEAKPVKGTSKPHSPKVNKGSSGPATPNRPKKKGGKSLTSYGKR